LTSTARVADVARELGVIEQTLGNWVRQERVDRGERDGLSTEEREEMARLRREVKRLTMERDLLKRSVAFWVKELDR
jgi:transposase